MRTILATVSDAIAPQSIFAEKQKIATIEKKPIIVKRVPGFKAFSSFRKLGCVKG